MYPLPAYTVLSVRFHQHLSNEIQFLEPRSPRSYRQAEDCDSVKSGYEISCVSKGFFAARACAIYTKMHASAE